MLGHPHGRYVLPIGPSIEGIGLDRPLGSAVPSGMFNCSQKEASEAHFARRALLGFRPAQ